MPSEYIIDANREVVFSKGTGVFSREEYLNHIVRLLRDPQFRPNFNHVVDCRAITSMDLPVEQIANLAERSGFSPQSRCAFIVASDLQYGLTRAFATYREIQGAWPTKVFRELGAALAWLDLPLQSYPYITEPSDSSSRNS